MSIVKLNRPDHTPRGYEWLPDAFRRDVEPLGAAALEQVREAFAEGDIVAVLIDKFGERRDVPARMWSKAPVAERVYPRFEDGQMTFTLKLYGERQVTGPIFVPSAALAQALAGEAPAVAAADHPPETHSGFAGRPSAQHIYQAEFTRRVENGKIEPSLIEQSRVLHDWFAIEYPSLRNSTPKAIADNIREAYQKAPPRAKPPTS